MFLSSFFCNVSLITAVTKPTFFQSMPKSNYLLVEGLVWVNISDFDLKGTVIPEVLPIGRGRKRVRNPNKWFDYAFQKLFTIPLNVSTIVVILVEYVNIFSSLNVMITIFL